MATNIKEFLDGGWLMGVNSAVDPTLLPERYVQWSENTTNRGGTYQTRPGFNRLPKPSLLYPRGLTIFQPEGKDPHLVGVFGGVVLALAWPFTGTWKLISSIWAFDPSDTPATFEVCMKGARTNPDGTLTVLDKPYPVLIIQTGYAKAVAWDGKNLTILDPADNQTPIGTWMKWASNRLWVSTGNKMRVSNILDPFTFTEEDILAEGGYFTLPDECTGIGLTSDEKFLLAFTSTTTTAFQAGIRARNTWGTTPDFQKLILPNIGCVAGNTIVNQYGILWWLSQGGLTRLDNALTTYRTSKIRYIDNNMARSKGNISDDTSRACAGWFENFLVLSVPSGDIHNVHTWIMDQSTFDLVSEEQPPVWSSVWKGIRPVQWATGNIKGQSRCFAVSADVGFPGSTYLFEPNVWEAFSGVKKDIGANVGGFTTVKEIECSLELRYLGRSEEWKAFNYASLELSQLSGLIHLEVFYASRHSGYKQVLDKDIVATTNSMTVGVDLNGVESYVKQTRTIKTNEDEAQSSDSDSGVESKLTRNLDKAFVLLIKWRGELAIDRVKLCTTIGEYHIETEEDETKQRYVKPNGSGLITTVNPVASSLIHRRTSSNPLLVSPRWQEIEYKSLT